ncbi:MAG: hypothetical protein MUC87_12120 [Bacteroidia bacterium]|jgi:hypothetical protein|nr:hypothetical protein [Bacteroidia bacterium]
MAISNSPLNAAPESFTLAEPKELEVEKGIFKWWWWWRRCRVRILFVAEGGIDYSTDAFGLSEVITKALNTSSRPNVTFQITKASYGGDSTADIQNFRFTDPGFSINNYDEVWIFGVSRDTSILPLAERQALANFMNAGGGVFATGDHEDLGAFMSAEIPRVRSMRKWYFSTPQVGDLNRQTAPPVVGPDRHDTSMPGPTPGIDSEDQSDEVPQNIIPKLYGSGGSLLAHPLLQKRGGMIRVLPDHMHEGSCVFPGDPTEALLPGSSLPEYPFLAGSTSERVIPEIIAISNSGGGGTPNFSGEVNPRCFGAISAYDGHLATGNIGRVSVDATWHHFLNINLDGTGSSYTGFYVGGVPNAAYEDIKQYFRNIALWLAPKYLQKCFRYRWIYWLRYKFPLIWELRVNEKATVSDLRAAGEKTIKMIREEFGDAEVAQTIITFVNELPETVRYELLKEVNPWMNTRTDKGEFNISKSTDDNLLRAEAIAECLIGGVVQSIVNNTPLAPQQFENLLEKGDLNDEKMASIVIDGISLGLNTYSDAMAGVREKAAKYSEMLKVSSADIKRGL